MQDLYVVAVQMHGMGGGCGVIDNYADGAVAVEVLDIPYGVKGEVLLICKEENGTVVICAEGYSVESPEEMASGVDVEVDIEISGCGRCGGRDGVVGNREGEGIVGASSGVRHIPGSACGCFGCAGLVVVDRGQSIGLICDGTFGGDVGSHPERRVELPYVGGDENVSALPNS